MTNINPRWKLLKQLLYQSCNRGCKETNLIIGGFAKLYLEKMHDHELQSFKEILQISDMDLYDWYTHKKELPKEKSSDIMLQLLSFDPTQV